MSRDLFFYHPVFRDNGISFGYDMNSQIGFSGIESDEHFVYTLYSGKTIEDFFRDGTTCRHLLVYDWNGNPVRRYNFQLPLLSFCLNATSDKIYGVAFNPETVIVQYDLK